MFLSIDPLYTWHTYLGGNGNDLGYSVAVDSNDNIYICGLSDGGWGLPVNNYGNGFVAKLDSSGSLIWKTFLIGTSSIAVDGNGNVYVSGPSATWGARCVPTVYALIHLLLNSNSNGNLLWNTFLGGNSLDGESGIVVDGSGNAYVSGYSIGTWGTPLRAFSSPYDAYAAKLIQMVPWFGTHFLGERGVTKRQASQ